MLNETIKQLLEAGVHFGHQTKRWNPKMERYIFGERSGIYIIDLEKTAEALKAARDFVKGLATKGEVLLFVGTKKQAQDIIKTEALRCSMPFVNQRWLGGMLTNYTTIRKSITRLRDIERMEQDGTFKNLKKKEVSRLTKELEKLKKNLEGVLAMEELPKALFIVDTKKDDTAVKEANKLGIPVIGLIDTNCDPETIDYPIPGNDDAMKSIRLITSLISESVIEGRKDFLSYLSQEGVAYTAETPEGDAAALAIGSEPQVTPVEEEIIAEVAEKIEERPAAVTPQPIRRKKPRIVKKDKE